MSTSPPPVRRRALTTGPVRHAEPVRNSHPHPPVASAKAGRQRAGPAAGSPPEPSSAESQAAVRVLRQFRLVFNTVKTHFRNLERQVGLGGAQVWALSVVREQPGIGVNGLARAMDVRQPTASNLLRSLVEQGLVEVRRDERDGRAVKLFLKPAAERLLAKVPGPFSGVLPEALSALDADTLARLEQDLSVLIDRLGADAQGANIPLSQI